MAPGNKKGLSLEEKRKKMMEIFYETKDVYLLKDLEKIAPKSKGITPMSVKEVVTSLVDDGLVDSEKIGTSIYFWAFPRCSFIHDLLKGIWLDYLPKVFNVHLGGQCALPVILNSFEALM